MEDRIRTLISYDHELHPTSQEYIYSLLSPIRQEWSQFTNYEELINYVKDSYYEPLAAKLLFNVLGIEYGVNIMLAHLYGLIVDQLLPGGDEDEDECSQSKSYPVILPWDINAACHVLYEQYGLTFDNLEPPGVVNCTINGFNGDFSQDYVIGFLLWCQLHHISCDIDIRGGLLTASFLDSDRKQGIIARYTPIYEDGEYHLVLLENDHRDYYLATIGDNTWAAETDDFFAGMNDAAVYYNGDMPEIDVLRVVYRDGQYFYEEVNIRN